MADNLNYPNPGTGTVIAFRDASGTGAGPYFQRIDTSGIVAHDTAAASYYPLLVGGYASAAAPTGVSADGDAVQGWFLRNGAECVQITASGALIPGDATNGLKVQSSSIAGDIAHGSADSGNPLKQGRVAVAHGVNPTAVAAGQRTNVYANVAGIPFVMGGHPNIQSWRVNFTSTQTNVPIITGVGGTLIVVTAFIFTLDNASTVFPSVLLGFGTTTPIQIIGAHGGLPAGGGFSRGDGSGILGISPSGYALLLTTSTFTSGSGNGINLIVTGYTITV